MAGSGAAAWKDIARRLLLGGATVERRQALEAAEGELASGGAGAELAADVERHVLGAARQTAGRAARNVEGEVLMYADNITGSIERAISETDRRRKIQVAYNKEHKITPQWARRLAQRFLQTGQVPQARPCGRTPIPITAKEIEAVSEAYEIYHAGAVRLKKIMASQMKVDMSKRRIHQILRQLKLAKRSYKKSKRRKWVRFERYNSNSLWHTDWTKIGRLWQLP